VGQPARAFVIERDEAIAGFVVREQALRKMSVTQSVQTLESLRTKSWLKRMGERLGKPSNELQNAQSEYKDYAEKFVLRMNEWFAKLWSQGEEKETAEQIAELYNAEPALVEWMKRRSVEMLVEHRSNEKKPDGRSARTEQERPNLHPKLLRIALSREVNTVYGAVVIAPWEVDDLPMTGWMRSTQSAGRAAGRTGSRR